MEQEVYLNREELLILIMMKEINPTLSSGLKHYGEFVGSVWKWNEQNLKFMDEDALADLWESLQPHRYIDPFYFQSILLKKQRESQAR